MTAPQDGGPAFPSQPLGQEGLPTDERDPGMSLRDWFAGMAGPAPESFTIPQPVCDDWDDAEKSDRAWSDWNVRRAVAWSFQYADAMLAERGRS